MSVKTTANARRDFLIGLAPRACQTSSRSWARRRRRRRGWFYGLAGVCLVAGVAYGLERQRAWAALAVIDNSNLAQNAASAARAAELVVSAGKRLTQLEGLLKGLGIEGGFGQAGDLSGVLRSAGTARSVLGQVKGLSGMTPNLGSMKRIANVFGVSTDIGKIEGFPQMSRVVRDLFGTVKREAERHVDRRISIESRKVFHRDSAADALAVAMQSRKTLSDSSDRIGQVAEAASNATNLREQMAVNTAAILLVAEELQQLRAVASAQAQLLGAGYFGDRPPDGFLAEQDSVPATQQEGAGSQVFQ